MENLATAATPAQSMLERLGQQLSTTATAQAVYGTPVERDGITVIPVARVRYGFGGGGGGGTQPDDATGTGLGGRIAHARGLHRAAGGPQPLPAHPVVGGAAGGGERGHCMASAAQCA
jgi:hypothetical protein